MAAERGFDGLRVLAFESRRATEIAELIRRHGGEPLSAPSMREVPLGESGAVREFAAALERGEIDVAVFLTGVGTRFLVEAIGSALSRERLAEALGGIVTVARGPKPRAALAELGIRPTILVPEPNTWRELLAAIDAHGSIAGRTLAVQEYGEENPELVAGLSERGAIVRRVPIYRWALPADLEPLRSAIAELIAGTVDVVLFTSATQAEHVFRVAERSSDALRAGFGRAVVASIGPIASGALRRHGVGVDLEPDHPKMGHLVRTAAEQAHVLLQRKRGSAK